MVRGSFEDGVVDGVVEDGPRTTYSVMVYGETTRQRLLLENVPREQLFIVQIGPLDKLGLLKDSAQYFVDMALDLFSMVIFIRTHQYKYFAMNLCGILLTALLQSSILGSAGCCRSLFESATGLGFFAECREAWIRGYRTKHFIMYKTLESYIEGVVSMGVQMYALVYEDSYSTVQILVIAASIVSSIVCYAQIVGIEFIELLRSRKLTNPQEQRH